MNTVLINKKEYDYPSRWEELKAKDLLFAAPLLLGSTETVALRKASILFYFIPSIKKFWALHPWVKWLIKKAPKAVVKYPVLNEAQKWELLQTTNFLFDDLSGKAILKKFTHNGITYFLPGDNFTRESIIAFAFADEYFNRYIETGDHKNIDLLIGCIARQKGTKLFPALQFAEGDYREHFSTARTEERAREFKTLPENIKTTVLLFFMGSKKYIHTHYEIMFRKREAEKMQTDEGAEPQKKIKSFGKKKIPKPNFNWLGVIYELSETGVFGNFDQVKNMFIHTCCYYLAKKRYEKEEQTQ